MIPEPEETGCAETSDLSPISCWNSTSSRQHIWPRLTQLGATFISDILVSQLPTFENLVYYKLDGEEAKRKVFFYYKTHKYKTRVMEEFIRMMHEQFKKNRQYVKIN